MDRKEYMKNIYSKYWIYAREKKYGFLEYDKNLCNYISKNVSKKKILLMLQLVQVFLLEIFFKKKGIMFMV